MRSKEDPLQVRGQAVALRRAGKSRREIRAILRVGNGTLDKAFKGVPPPPWTRRARARDDARAAARDLRAQGLSLKQIAAKLGVSKSSVSLWVRDPALPPLSPQEWRRLKAEASRRYWARERPLREARRKQARSAAAAEIGDLTDREVLIAGAIAYWCEGAKSKPHRRAEQIIFINSDPELIKFFLRFLRVAGVMQERLVFRIYIHEFADVAEAHRFWLGVTGAQPAQFRRPTLKRHNPTTVRKNVGNDYHGCLRVDVLQGAELYQRIEGWAAAVMGDDIDTRPTAPGSAEPGAAPVGSGSEPH
jgi:transcriptional regulator with XRE-family HTH domain